MFQAKIADLPFRGFSHRLVGADCGDTNACVYFVNAPPGKGPVLHRHPYDELAIVHSGRALWTVEGREFEVGAGEVLVVKAGERHKFRNIGDTPLVSYDVHWGKQFEQENLE
ncbi:MAG TPA: cupin domain-containing protein [Gemmatimonadaceae bacterium]